MAATPGDKCPAHDIFCPVHADVQLEIRTMKGRQDSRHCGAHEAQIHSALDDIDKLENENASQWDAINNLRRLVYIGMGGVSVAAFFGSIVGQLLINHFKGH